MVQFFHGVRVDGTQRAAGVPANVAWTPVGYERAVQFWLDRIQGTATGRALLAAVQPPGQVTVVPGDRVDSPGTSPLDERNRDAWRAGHRHGVPARHGRGGLIGGVGTGQGTPTIIHFTPAEWIARPAHEQPDMILTHELAHASRYIAGVVSNRPLPPNRGLLTVEEAHCMLIANMYRSERNCAQFRISHRPTRYGTLRQAMATFRLGAHLFRQMHRRQRELYDALRAVDTPFNPLPEILG